MTCLFRWLSRGPDGRIPLFTRRRDETRRILELERQLDSLAQECRRAGIRERERIACWLHDEIGQQMVLIRLKLGQLRAGGQPASALLLDELGTLAAQAADTTRALTYELGASLGDAGLLPALQGIAQELSRRSGIAVSVDVPHAGFELPDPQHSVACRAVREFCLNVHKHARAHRASITSTIEAGCLSVAVQDDGEGFEGQSPLTWQARSDGGFGLASAQAQLRALGGDLQLSSRPGRGTCARLVLPLATA